MTADFCKTLPQAEQSRAEHTQTISKCRQDTVVLTLFKRIKVESHLKNNLKYCVDPLLGLHNEKNHV